jgi:hypothetical protein
MIRRRSVCENRSDGELELLEFWHSLQLPSFSQGWRDFPPLQRAITVFAVGAIFTNFFIRDYNRGGRRFWLYGPVALLLLAYAASISGLF